MDPVGPMALCSLVVHWRFLRFVSLTPLPASPTAVAEVCCGALVRALLLSRAAP